MRLVYVILCIFGCLSSNITASRILGLFPYNGRSHWNFFRPLFVALAEKGHDVTVLGHFPEKHPHPRYKDISLAGSLPDVVNNITFDFILGYGKIRTMTSHWDDFGYKVCDIVIDHPKVQELARSTDNYDLIITEFFGTDCFLPFVNKFKVPFIGLISSTILPHATDMVDLPDNPSYVASYVVPFTHDMNIFERTINLICTVGYKIGYHVVSRRNTERIVRRVFPETKSLLDLSNNVSLIIINSHFSINGATPGVPALIEAGGMHIPEPKALPKDLAKLLDGAKDGVVYFSLGSLVRSDSLPPEKLQALISAFASLKQTVLWKIDGKIPANLPKNIVTNPWLPQLDVLCHPNVLLFINHGGLSGTQESVSCGVPMIGIPLFGDQEHNIQLYQSQGLAIQVDFHSLTEQVIKNAINKVLNNPKYKASAELAAELFRDRPQKPLDTAIYWVEYVIKYKGAPHLRTSARNLNWFQYFLLDVLVIMLLIIFALLLLVVKCYRVLSNLVRRKKEIKHKNN